MFLQREMRELLGEWDSRWKGWIVEGRLDGVEMSTKKNDDDIPLKHTRVWTDIEASPGHVYNRILNERLENGL